jgi:hypothetical protein
MPDLQVIPTIDTALFPDMNSWSSPPAGYLLLIEEGPPDDFYLSIDDSGNRLLIG